MKPVRAIKIKGKPEVRRNLILNATKCVSCGTIFDSRGYITTSKGALCPSCAE